MNRKRKGNWLRLESGLYIPPLLSLRPDRGPLGNPGMMGRGMGRRCCCKVQTVECVACQDNLAPAEILLSIPPPPVNPDVDPEYECDEVCGIIGGDYVLTAQYFSQCELLPGLGCQWCIGPLDDTGCVLGGLPGIAMSIRSIGGGDYLLTVTLINWCGRIMPGSDTAWVFQKTYVASKPNCLEFDNEVIPYERWIFIPNTRCCLFENTYVLVTAL